MNSLRPLVFPPLHRVAGRPPPRSRTFSRFGAIVGLQVFLTMALLPLLLYGGAASEQLASGLFGKPETPGFGVNASIVLGVASTVAASLFAVLGGVATASVRALTRTVMVPKG
jgi:hypothetical protein